MNNDKNCFIFESVTPKQTYLEGDSEVYINFEFLEYKTYTFPKHVDLQSQEIYIDKKISRKVYIF